MKLENDDELRQALALYADTTTTSSDAWNRTLDRTDRGRGRRRIGFSVAAVTAAVAVIAAGVVLVANPSEDASESLQLATVIEATTARESFGFSVVTDITSPGTQQGPAEGQFDTRRGVGWLRVQPPPPEFRTPWFPEPPAEISGADAVFDRQHVFLRSELVSAATSVRVDTPWVIFDRVNYGPLGQIANFAGRPNLPALADGLTDPNRSRWLEKLRTDSRLVAEGTEHLRGVATTRYRIWEDPALLERFEREGRGTTTSTVWIDGEGLLRRVRTHTGPSPASYPEPQMAFTETLEFYDFGAPLNHDLPPPSDVTDGSMLHLPEDFGGYGPLPVPGESRSPGEERPRDDPTFFSLRPVIRRLDPPCAPGTNSTSAVLQGSSDGTGGEGCFEVGPPAFDAGAVTAARAVSGVPGGDWAVEYTLTPDGETRFDAMAQQVGIGRPVAVIIDGVVVSALNLETTTFGERGHITGGFDEQAARLLAARLDPG